MTRHLAAATLLFALLFWARPGEACTCVGPQPTCRAFWRMDAVFTGEVISITDASRPLDAGGRMIQEQLKRVRLRVIEAFNGVSTAEIDVETGVGGGDCGYGFSVGVTYVVFANGRNGTLSTGICSNTKPLAAAAADLEFLRGLNGPAPTRARIFGKVIAWDYNENGGEPRPRLPFGGARVVATGAATGRFESTSTPDGTYEVLVPPGHYSVTVEVPSGRYAMVGFASIDLVNTRACAEVPVSVHSDGRIVGRVLDAAGRPVPGLAVELVADSRVSGRSIPLRPLRYARSSSTGAFEFTQIPPGQFAIGFNTQSGLPLPRVLFPGAISIGPGERIPVGDLKVPSSVGLRAVSGRVLDASGTPTEGARVYVRAATAEQRSIGEAVLTDRNGAFTVALVDGHSYRVFAEVRSKPGEIPGFRRTNEAVVPEVGTGTITLTIVR